MLRDARRIGEYHPGLSPSSPECMDRLGLALAHLESKCTNFYDSAEVERVFYPEIEKLLLEFFPDATDALVYNHDVFDKDYAGDRTEDQDAKNPGVNARYVNLVHNDLNDNSGRVRCRELLTRNLRNFGRTQNYTEEEADAKMSRRFMSLNLAKPMETVEQFPFVLCAWPSFADQPYITNYRIYDDRVGETTRFTYRPDHEWYWFPQQKPNEVSMLKCYDFGNRWVGVALVFPYRLYRPDRTGRREMPEECRGPVVCLLLGKQKGSRQRGDISVARLDDLMTVQGYECAVIQAHSDLRSRPIPGEERLEPRAHFGFGAQPPTVIEEVKIMKAGVVYPQIELGGDTGAVKAFAQAAEDLGYDHIVIYDHVLGAVHAGREPKLTGPYKETDPFHEPLITYAYLAGVTKTLELVTGVIILPQRQTALFAKQAADVDLFSDGRLRLGVGVGWNWVEFDGLEMSRHFRRRGRRQELQIALIRKLWEQPVVDHEDADHRIDRAGILPRPKRPIPIWLGGFSEAAYDRAARIGDGFLFSGRTQTEAAQIKARIEVRLRELGRDVDAFGFEFDSAI